MKNMTMNISLIITTYNWKNALKIILDSVLKQTMRPDEIVIADDGSSDGTAEMLNTIQQTFPIPIIHSWQKDEGFKAAQSRNKAISKSSGDYIIIIDGDMILSPKFIESHLKFAKEKQFIQGTRVPTTAAGELSLFNSSAVNLTFFSRNIRHRNNAIQSYTLAKIFSRIKNDGSSIRSCNMSFWKSDLIECNGFNEDFIGWGREDTEITYRLYNCGKQRLYLRFAAIAFHIYHPENNRQQQNSHQYILNNTIDNKITRCKNGLDKYL